MEEIKIAKELTVGLLERMGVRPEVEGFLREGALHLEIRGDQDSVLIGKHGRTLEALQMLINRMVNKKLKSTIRITLDIDDYRKRRADSMAQMAHRMAEKAKSTGRPQTAGPLNAHDRRVIHLALKEDPLIKTESLGEGDLKKIKIIPVRKEG